MKRWALLAIIILLGWTGAARLQAQSFALSPVPRLFFLDANGHPASGYKLCTYQAGTATPLATYTSSTGTVPNTNPIILDSRGMASVWLSANTYKMILYSAGTDTTCATGTLQWSQDNISDVSLLLKANLASTSSPTLGAGMIGFKQSGAGAAAQTVQSKLQQYKNAADYSGADFSVKANNCLSALPSGGGVCDAGGLTGSQTGSVTISIPAKARLLMCGVDLSGLVNPIFLIHAASDSSGISGCGAAYTIVRTASTSVNGVQIGDSLTTPTTHVKIEGLTLIGPGSGAGTGIRMGDGSLNYVGSYNGVFRELSIKDWGSTGMDLIGSSSNTVESVDFSGNLGCGLRLLSSADTDTASSFNRIQDDTFSAEPCHVRLTSTGTVTHTHNIIEGNDFGTLLNPANTSIFNGGMELIYSSDARVRDNSFSGTSTTWVNTTSATSIPGAGAITITVAAATNIAIGSLLVVDGDQDFSELVTVTGISGTSVTFTSVRAHTTTPYKVRSLYPVQYYEHGAGAVGNHLDGNAFSAPHGVSIAGVQDQRLTVSNNTFNAVPMPVLLTSDSTGPHIIVTNDFDSTSGVFMINTINAARIETAVDGGGGVYLAGDIHNISGHSPTVPTLSTGYLFLDQAVVVGDLPAADPANAGKQVQVNDSTTVAVEGQTCAGGSNKVALAFSDGTVWKCF